MGKSLRWREQINTWVKPKKHKLGGETVWSKFEIGFLHFINFNQFQFFFQSLFERSRTCDSSSSVQSVKVDTQNAQWPLLPKYSKWLPNRCVVWLFSHSSKEQEKQTNKNKNKCSTEQNIPVSVRSFFFSFFLFYIHIVPKFIKRDFMTDGDRLSVWWMP